MNAPSRPPEGEATERATMMRGRLRPQKAVTLTVTTSRLDEAGRGSDNRRLYKAGRL